MDWFGDVNERFEVAEVRQTASQYLLQHVGGMKINTTRGHAGGKAVLWWRF